MNRIERLKVNEMKTFARCLLSTGQHSLIDCILVFGPRSQSGGLQDLFGRDAIHQEWITKCQFVLSERTGLSLPGRPCPASSSIEARRLTIRA
ncbi:MAG: hypothetical protein R3C49_06225 [Planctomycetaceae bacterium]